MSGTAIYLTTLLSQHHKNLVTRAGATLRTKIEPLLSSNIIKKINSLGFNLKTLTKEKVELTVGILVTSKIKLTATQQKRILKIANHILKKKLIKNPISKIEIEITPQRELPLFINLKKKLLESDSIKSNPKVFKQLKNCKCSEPNKPFFIDALAFVVFTEPLKLILKEFNLSGPHDEIPSILTTVAAKIIKSQVKQFEKILITRNNFSRLISTYILLKPHPAQQNKVAFKLKDFQEEISKLNPSTHNFLRIKSTISELEQHKDSLNEFIESTTASTNKLHLVKKSVETMEYFIGESHDASEQEVLHELANSYFYKLRNTFRETDPSNPFEDMANEIKESLTQLEVTDLLIEHLYNTADEIKDSLNSQKRRRRRALKEKQANTTLKLSTAIKSAPQIFSPVKKPEETPHAYKLRAKKLIEKQNLKSRNRTEDHENKEDSGGDFDSFSLTYTNRKEGETSTSTYSPDSKENNDRIFNLTSLNNLYITTLAPHLENIEEFTSTIQDKHYKLLGRNSLGESGIKMHDPLWVAVKSTHTSNRLICLKVESDDTIIYVPTKVVTHANYEKLITDRQGFLIKAMHRQINALFMLKPQLLVNPFKADQ